VKLYIIAGEASGDLHGAKLIEALRKERREIDVRAWGGDLMAAAGSHIVKHYKELAFMGFIEVVLNLRTILRNIAFCKEDISAYRPDAVILIDYPGFNLRIAQFCKQIGIPVLYYISPQLWAWKENRIHAIKRDITRMFVILPFEKDFYAKHGMEVDFVGHPLLDVVDAAQARLELPLTADDRAIVALLPGSRKQEIKTMLPIMLETAKQFSAYRFVIAGAPGQDAAFYEGIPGAAEHEIVFGQTYALLQQARAALVTSGTATLEAALHRTPLAVCYKGSAISYAIARRLVKIKYISLVNLILDRRAIREIIQHELTAKVLTLELEQLLHDERYRQAQFTAFDGLRQVLGGPGAADRTATGMLKTLDQLQTDAKKGG
jgi:lipid-A-disaccharide synthase